MRIKKHYFRRANGTFRRGTLRDLGFADSEISDGSLKTCEKCNKQSRPILVNGWICECGHKQKGNK